MSSLGFLKTHFPQNTHKVHGACLHSQDPKAEISIICDKKSIGLKKIDEARSDYLLTPIMVMILADQFDLALWFAEKYKPDVNKSDSKGWTVMHHTAAKRHQGLLLCLLKLNPKRDLSNSFHGTFTHLLSLSKKTDPAMQTIPVKQDGKVVKVNAGEFLPTIQASSFATENYLSDENLFELWRSAPPANNDPVSNIEQSYNAFRANPPSLYLKEVEGAGICLIAGQEFKAGEIVTEYFGEVQLAKPPTSGNSIQQIREQATELMEVAKKLKPQPKKDTYQYENVFPHEHRSMASMMADGVPICRILPMPNLMGLAVRRAVVALVDIFKDTILTFDYGIKNSAKVLTHQELHKERLIALFKEAATRDKNKSALTFLADQALEEVLEAKPIDLGDKSALQKMFEVETFIYLVQTPSACLLLVAHGLIDAKQLQMLIYDSNIMGLILENSKISPHYIIIMKMFAVLLKEFATTDINIQEVEQKINSLTAIELMNYMAEKAQCVKPDIPTDMSVYYQTE